MIGGAVIDSIGWRFEVDLRSWLFGIYISSEELEFHMGPICFYHWQKR